MESLPWLGTFLTACQRTFPSSELLDFFPTTLLGTLACLWQLGPPGNLGPGTLLGCNLHSYLQLLFRTRVWLECVLCRHTVSMPTRVQPLADLLLRLLDLEFRHDFPLPPCSGQPGPLA